MTAPDVLGGERWKIVTADSLAHLATLPADSVDAVVCDPPYGIDIDGQAWDGRDLHRTGRASTDRALSDSQAFGRWATLWGTECHRVLKPGGHLLAFGAPRTWHRLATGLEDAGLELRDTLVWIFGQGLIKGRRLPGGQRPNLKPGHEPIVLMRKAFSESTGPANIEVHGTGGLNIEDCRITGPGADEGAGRLPANVLFTHTPQCHRDRSAPSCPVGRLDRQSGVDASRFFYCGKARRHERDAGCEHLPAQRTDLFPHQRTAGQLAPPVRNHHPTVKPLAVMRWLIRLAVPPDGVVLDPFCGSGSTGCAALLEDRRFLGIEREQQYARIAQARIAHWAAEPCPNSGRQHARPTRAARPRRRPT